MKINKICFIFFNCLYTSFQIIQAKFFCDNYLRNIYLFDENTKSYKLIETEKEEKYWTIPYSYDNLKAEPGDLIMFNCSNEGGPTLGAGCFLINNKCRCYNFNCVGVENKSNWGSHQYTIKFNNNIECSFLADWLDSYMFADYFYYHYVPLDVDEIKCKNEVITLPKNVDNIIRFSNFIESSFNIKNLKISVKENFKYFTINNKQLTSNDIFNISKDLIFFHNETSKIKINFINYGVVIDNNKTCEINIRVCYDRCLKCIDKNSNETFHQCLSCKDGFYLVEDTNNCITKEEMNDSNYYFDEINKKYKKCYKNCYGCYENSNETNHNCKNCIDGYHFIYNETGKCINNEEKPSDTYLDIESNTYKKCYERCSSCDEYGDNINNNCKECLKDDNNNYIYHFIYNEKGKCITEKELNGVLFFYKYENNTFILCPVGTYKVENNHCFIEEKHFLTALIIMLILIIIILIFVIIIYFVVISIISL